MSEYDLQSFDSKRLALVALSSPNVRHPNDEPDPRMLCKCKRGCNKESKTGSIFCSDAVLGLVQSALLNHGQLIGTLHHLASVTTLIAAMVLLDFFVLGNCLQTDFHSLSLSTDLSKVCVPEVYLSVHTLYFLTVSSELLRGLSSVLLV